MPNPNPAPDRLRQIKTFPSLVKYLRDDLDWPIESDDFDELTFDYDPEELGLDAKAAVKIKQIKQLRPLADNQPWGIFFINFEPKRLPVVALRRILRSLVIKKRQSANRPQQAAWQLHDLLFISSYGEADHRDITFAHFSEDADHDSGLPTLRVLGWDDEDTVLHLVHAHTTLKEKLRWPEDDADLDAWRSQWSSAFTLRHREVINTSRALAVRMAALASAIRKRANRVLSVESDKGPLRKLMSAFKEALIHDLSDDDFADMYAQTITYGLLTARVSRPAGLVADNVADMVPITNPFLKELMETFLNLGGRRNGRRRESRIDFDELGVNDVVDLLRDPKTNMEAILRDFGDRNPQEDPVIHFYEDFLKEYDAKKRMQRGVFYTPRPVVSFIVRSVDELLRTEFGLEDGLADTTTWGAMAERFPPLPPGEGRGEGSSGITIPEGTDPDSPFVQILDPATGTGTFLVEVIGLIHKTMTAEWEKEGHLPLTDIPQLWNEYVPKHLLPRLHGYELMMAPYAIAHMKIGLKLYETGYRFESDERARVYLTNALEAAHDFSGTLAFAIPAMAHEAEAVNAIKRDQMFTVVIGNPPYSVSSQNRGDWARALIERYKEDLNEKKHTLDDDYVKFVAFSQGVVENAGLGVWGFITNHGYIKNPTFRGMRKSLLGTFSTIRLLDLHGNLRQREGSGGAGIDENVFDIQQGVAIALGTCTDPNRSETYSADIVGARATKYADLLESSVSTTQWTTLHPAKPFFLFVHQDQALQQEYSKWPSLPELFRSYGSGIKTDRDELCIDSDKEGLLERMQVLFSGKYDHEFIEQYNVRPSSSYDIVELARRTRYSEDDVIRCLYRPFDLRWLYYKRGFTSRPAFELMQHMLPGGNIGLLSARTNKSGTMDHFFCTRVPTEVKVAESTTQSCLFPLYSVEDSEGLHGRDERRANLSSAFLAHLLDSPKDCDCDPHVMSFTPEVAFQYIYAVVHSLRYRVRYADLLRIDFPRIPIPADLELLHALSRLGNELMALHLLESALLDRPITTYTGPPNPEVEKVSYSDGTVWLDKKQTRGLVGVPEVVWNFHIGGYQVCQKWLKDRQAKGGKNPRAGRVLTDEDIDHYQKIVVALRETIRIMAEIDEVIEAHGGWPDAFVTE